MTMVGTTGDGAAASAGTIPGYGMEAGAGTIGAGAAGAGIDGIDGTTGAGVAAGAGTTGAGAAAGTTGAGVMVTITFIVTETSPITQAGVDIITVTI